MTFEMKKVFDCQDMPDDVRNAFFATSEQGNDCYVNVGVTDGDMMEAEDFDTERSLVINWLWANGASPEDDSVIVQHWW